MQFDDSLALELLARVEKQSDGHTNFPYTHEMFQVPHYSEDTILFHLRDLAEQGCFVGPEFHVIGLTARGRENLQTLRSKKPGIKIDLTFGDIVRLGANTKLEKDGVTITFGRPTLSEVTADPKKNIGKVVFWLDETDPRSASAW
jgi:hypothetical protein